MKNRKDNGRLFTDYTEESLSVLLKNTALFEVIKLWKTDDVRRERYQKSEKYMKTVVAYVNGRGGRIIFGIDDITHEVVGMNPNTVLNADAANDSMCHFQRNNPGVFCGSP